LHTSSPFQRLGTEKAAAAWTVIGRGIRKEKTLRRACIALNIHSGVGTFAGVVKLGRYTSTS